MFFCSKEANKDTDFVTQFLICKTEEMTVYYSRGEKVSSKYRD